MFQEGNFLSRMLSVFSVKLKTECQDLGKLMILNQTNCDFRDILIKTSNMSADRTLFVAAIAGFVCLCVVIVQSRSETRTVACVHTLGQCTGRNLSMFHQCEMDDLTSGIWLDDSNHWNDWNNWNYWLDWNTWTPWYCVRDWYPWPMCSFQTSWDTWTAWSGCSRDCGVGRQIRTREYQVGWCPFEVKTDFVWFEECCQETDSEEGQCGNCYYGGYASADGTICECVGRHYGQCCQNLIGACITIPADVIFVLDSSLSQTREQFQKQLEFVIDFTQHVNISNENFQIGVVTFSTLVKVDVDINLNLTKDDLQEAVRNISFQPGATFTNKGLSQARQILQARRTRISEDGFNMPTMKYVIVLTDGMSTSRAETKTEAQLLKNTVDKVIVIGIGKQVSHMELITIASPPDKQSLSYIFSVDDFNALNTIIAQLVNVTCERCNTSSQSDIVFLLDKSASIQSQEFQIALDDVTYMIENIADLGETEGQNIAVMLFNEKLETFIQLESGQDKAKILPALQQLTRAEGHCDTPESSTSCRGINITRAILETSQHAFAPEHGGRDIARKFLVALTNGKFANINKVKSIMGKFNQESDVNLSVIGLGEDVNMEGLLSLVNDPNHVFLTLSNEDREAENLKVLMGEFRYNVCNMTET